MTSFYLNLHTQSEGENEVHVKGCLWFPNAANALYLGEFAHCRYAVEYASRKFLYMHINGCAHCLPECDTDE